MAIEGRVECVSAAQSENPWIGGVAKAGSLTVQLENVCSKPPGLSGVTPQPSLQGLETLIPIRAFQHPCTYTTLINSRAKCESLNCTDSEFSLSFLL